MWSSQLFPTGHLPETLTAPPTDTHTDAHPPSTVSPYIYLTALCAPSKTFTTVWFNQQRQIISFSFFLLFFLFIFVFYDGERIWVHGFNMFREQSFSVTSFSTGRADADMTTSMRVFIANYSDQDPVWGVYTCVHTRDVCNLEPGTWIWTSNSTICFTKHLSVLFLEICLY